MKVLVNNFKDIETPEYPKKITCDKCHSELEYSKEDIKYGEFGIAQLECPLCHSMIELEDNEGLDITVNNIKYPDYFGHVCKDNAVDLTNKEVSEMIKEVINCLQADKDENMALEATGDTCVIASRDDTQYYIIVTKDYHECYANYVDE